MNITKITTASKPGPKEMWQSDGDSHYLSPHIWILFTPKAQ